MKTIDISKRTKGKLKLASDKHGDEYATNVLGGQYNRVLAKTIFDNRYFTIEEAEANSAFIVKAWNSYNSMYEILQDLAHGTSDISYLRKEAKELIQSLK